MFLPHFSVHGHSLEAVNQIRSSYVKQSRHLHLNLKSTHCNDVSSAASIQARLILTTFYSKDGPAAASVLSQ